jgi:hypothetical protein
MLPFKLRQQYFLSQRSLVAKSFHFPFSAIGTKSNERKKVWIANQDTTTGNLNGQPEREYETTTGRAERMGIEPFP